MTELPKMGEPSAVERLKRAPRRTQRHLKELVDFYGRGGDDATGKLKALIEAGLKIANERSQAEWEASHPDGKTNPHVTDSGKCPRQVFFSLTGVEATEKLTTDSLINFGVGSAVEEWLGDVLNEAGLDFVREVRVEIEHKGTLITGRIDFCFLSSGRLIELKTTSSRAMGFMLRNQEQGRTEHRLQAMLYLHASRFGKVLVNGEQVNIDEAYLAYITKDATKGEPAVNAWHVPYDETIVGEALDYLASIDAAAKAGRKPSIPIEFIQRWKDKGNPGFPCSYCSFKQHCWNVGETGKIFGPKEGE